MQQQGLCVCMGRCMALLSRGVLPHAGCYASAYNVQPHMCNIRLACHACYNLHVHTCNQHHSLPHHVAGSTTSPLNPCLNAAVVSFHCCMLPQQLLRARSYHSTHVSMQLCAWPVHSGGLPSAGARRPAGQPHTAHRLHQQGRGLLRPCPHQPGRHRMAFFRCWLVCICL
jgi:hypothetical protein